VTERKVGRHRLGALFVSVVTCAGLAAGAVGTSPAAAADLDAVQLDVAPFASGLSDPVAIAFRAGDNRLYVAEQPGTVRIVSTTGVVSPTAVLALTVGSGSERGLLGLTFSPDGTKLYVDYTESGGDITVAEYTMAGDVATVSSRRELLRIEHSARGNHNGGQIVTGPDGMLYIATGDGGGGGDPDQNGQDLNELLGKILRIDPAPSATLPYTIPADNPFVGQANRRGEIWMYGLRNPWKFSFDRLTGEMLIADVGQGEYEEVDLAAAGEKGSNWGWNLREGFHPYNGGAQPPNGKNPIFELSHDDGYCAVIGGHVYRGSAIANLDGAYVYTDLCASNIAAWADGAQRDFPQTFSSPTTFGEDHSGELYVGALDGTISKLVPVPGGPATVSAGDQSMLEGNTGIRKMTFAVTLSEPADAPVTVRYAVTSGTATGGPSKKPGVDFRTMTGTLRFPKGSASKTVMVSVFGDTAPEPDETFAITLSNPTGGYSLGRAVGSATALNDDGGAGGATIGVGDAAIVPASSGQQNLVVPVTLSEIAPAVFTVTYTITPGTATHSSSASGGGDFGGPLSGTLKFNRSTWRKNVSVPIWSAADIDVDVDKTFTITLTGVNPAGVTVARATGTGTILDN